ncbi:MAG: CinA family protein [Clostridia bacterium]|nr:CinA family protein [Clostridia bacterium]
MKNACVVLRKRMIAGNVGENAVLQAFSARGYTFSEMYVFDYLNETKIRETLSCLQKSMENVLLLADKSVLSIARNYISEVYPNVFPQGEMVTAGIFGNQKHNLFLLSADDTETGTMYAKQACLPVLDKKYGVSSERLVIRAMGANEARVEALTREAENLAKNAVSCTHVRDYDDSRIEIAYNNTLSKSVVDGILRLFVDGLGDSVYALDDTPINEQLIHLLKLRKLRISVAESFTGGGVARKLTAVSGASEVYFEGLNTYNERSKLKRLGVSEYTLRTFGAVSDQCAYEMCAGLLKTGDCELAISTTGLAGPNTDKTMLPVGLCYVAVGTKERIFVYRYKFDGSRADISEKAINYALFLAYKHAKNL